MVAADRRLPPIIGLARVGTLRAKEPPRGPTASRLDWYDYVAEADLPTVVVLQDLDDRPGYGAFWGEVHTAVHKALGAEGCVTNGSFRDCDMLAKDFQIIGGRIGPSHAHVHLVDFGKAVNVFGMQAGHDDIIHADYHGAVVIPAEVVTKLVEAIELVSRARARHPRHLRAIRNSRPRSCATPSGAPGRYTSVGLPQLPHASVTA